MKATTVIGVILIILSLGIGYIGFNKVADSAKSVNFLGLKFEASDESGKQEGYLYLGLAVVLFGGGIYTANKSK